MRERGLAVRACRQHLTRRGRAATLAAVAAAACALLAPSAHAIVVNQEGRSYGVTPIHGVPAQGVSGPSAPAARVRPFDGAPEGGGPLVYRGGPVMHSVTTHVVYWDPREEFTSLAREIVAGFFTAVAADSGKPTNVFAVAGQYTDGSGNAAYSSIFGGAAVDKGAYPGSGCAVPSEGDKGPYSNCISDKQLQEHLTAYVAANNLPRGPEQLYFVLLPHSVVTCLKVKECSNNMYCAYHGAISPGQATEIIYADIPFSLLDKTFVKGCQDDGNGGVQHPNGDFEESAGSTRYADVALKYTSHEYIEAATDPLLNAWFDENGLEIGDKCNGVSPDETENGIGYDANAFRPLLGGSESAGTLYNQLIAGHQYYLQSEWDNAESACRMQPASIGGAGFTSAPAAPATGTPVTFQGSAADPYDGLAYSWTFGDGTGASGPTPSHSYSAPGAYQVTMTAHDTLTGASAAPVTQTVTVTAPASIASTAQPAPSPPAAAIVPSASAPEQVQGLAAAFNAATGTVTLTGSVSGPGAVNWLATFPNGSFGAFAAARACRAGQIRLRGKCRPARVVFASGSLATLGGPFRLVLRPTASGLRALKAAFRRGRPLPVTVKLTFQPAQGATASSQTRRVAVRLRRL